MGYDILVYAVAAVMLAGYCYTKAKFQNDIREKWLGDIPEEQALGIIHMAETNAFHHPI